MFRWHPISPQENRNGSSVIARSSSNPCIRFSSGWFQSWALGLQQEGGRHKRHLLRKLTRGATSGVLTLRVSAENSPETCTARPVQALVGTWGGSLMQGGGRARGHDSQKRQTADVAGRLDKGREGTRAQRHGLSSAWDPTPCHSAHPWGPPSITEAGNTVSAPPRPTESSALSPRPIDTQRIQVTLNGHTISLLGGPQHGWCPLLTTQGWFTGIWRWRGRKALGQAPNWAPLLLGSL